MKKFNGISNPVFAIFNIENAHTANEKHIIFKVCKSAQTLNKYVRNAKNFIGWQIFSLDHYSSEIFNYLTVGSDLRKAQVKIETLKY